MYTREFSHKIDGKTKPEHTSLLTCFTMHFFVPALPALLIFISIFIEARARRMGSL